MSAHVLLTLLNELRKRDKMRRLFIYWISQLLTIGHDYPVLVDKHALSKILPHTFDPLGGFKGQIFKL